MDRSILIGRVGGNLLGPPSSVDISSVTECIKDHTPPVLRNSCLKSH